MALEMMKFRKRVDRQGKPAPLAMNPIKSIFKQAWNVGEEREASSSTEVPCLSEKVPLSAWKVTHSEEQPATSTFRLFRAKSEPSLRVDEIPPPVPEKQPGLVRSKYVFHFWKGSVVRKLTFIPAL